MIQEKIDQAIGILQEKNIDAWMTFGRETATMRDPMLDFIAGMDFTWQTALIITAKGDAIAIVGQYDVANLETRGNYREIIGYVESIREDLRRVLARLDPRQIAVNYSLSSPTADGLSAGMYMNLQEHLAGTPYRERLISAHEVIAALRGRKSPEELRRMKEATRITLEIFNMVTNFIRPGRTEREIADFVLREVENRGLELAWDPDHCPAVFSGPGTAGAHATPTGRTVQPGHLVNMDFGVKYEGYCADLQRTWYLLRPGETAPPEEVQRAFTVLRAAIDRTAAALQPGALGKDMDHIARQHLLDNGYAEFPHGLGHQVGREVHDGGGGLFPTWEKYGQTALMPAEAGQVYTIEPRLTLEAYGIVTIEEEVVVQKAGGAMFLSEPQRELWVISGE